MEILWLLYPVFQVGYQLFKPFIIAVVISFFAVDNKNKAKVAKPIALFSLIAYLVYLNIDHPKDYPMLFRVPEALTVLIYFYVYVKAIDLMSRGSSQIGLEKNQDQNRDNKS
jgi:hypothetical protein